MLHLVCSSNAYDRDVIDDSSYSSSEATSYSASTMGTRYRDRYSNLLFGGDLGWALPASECYQSSPDYHDYYKDGRSMRNHMAQGYNIYDYDRTDIRDDFHTPAKQRTHAVAYSSYSSE